MLDEYFINKGNQENEIEQRWKTKWLPYNLIVGVFGVLVVFTEITCLGQTTYHAFRFLPGIIFFGIMANLFYYMGVIIELFVYKNYPSLHFGRFGEYLFRIGTLFSIFIMLELEWRILDRFNLIPNY
jgi:uncharacterized membrane protein YdcZ (DUF606 family)